MARMALVCGRSAVSPYLSPLWLARCRGYRHRAQHGQALVFSLVTVSIIILTMVSMYTMGQQSINKMRLQNTADAAAYSAVLAEARDYNFSAYINRAVIANQVAVAQIVSLRSWAANLKTTYNGEMSWVPDVISSLGGPMAKVFWDTPWKVYKPTTKGIDTALNTAAGPAIKILDLLIDALNLAQTIYHYGTALTVAQTIGLSPAKILNKLAGVDSNSLGPVKDLLTFNDGYNVIKMNDPDADLSTPGTLTAIVHIVQWFLLTEKKDPNTAAKDGKDADRMAQVTLDSLDGFTRNRSTKNGGPTKDLPEMMYLTPSPFVADLTRLAPYQNGALLMYLWHRGGTELKKVNDKKKTWSAMDATGFFGFAIIWISILGIPIPIPIPVPFVPIGWGAAQTGESSDLSPTNNFGTSADAAYGGVYKGVNTAAAALRQKAAGPGSPLNGSSGLRAYFDVKKVEPDKDNLVGPALILEVEKSASAIKTSNAISGGQFTLTNGTQSNAMRSLSKAQVYFSRPAKLWPRGDGKTEHGSLYSPYWQARLAPSGFLEQYASLAYHLN